MSFIRVELQSIKIKKYFTSLVLLVLTCLNISCDQPSQQKQPQNDSLQTADTKIPNKETSDKAQLKPTSLQAFADQLQINYRLIDNRPSNNCDENQFDGSCFRASIQLSSLITMKEPGWKIYFSQLSPIIRSNSEYFEIKRVQGDLHYIKPKQKEFVFEKNKKYVIEFFAGFWQVSEYDSPPNFYIVSKDNVTHLIESTVAKVDPNTKLERLQHVSELTNKKAQLKRTENDNTEFATPSRHYEINQQNLASEKKQLNAVARIIPKPTKVMVEPEQFLDISDGLKLLDNSFDIDINNPGIRRLKKLGVKFNQNSEVNLSIMKSSGFSNEAYQLTIDRKKIEIIASTNKGAFYGIQSIASLHQLNSNTLPILKVEDVPRYDFRGLHLDVARNFRDKAFVLALLDQMAAYKLNKLHLHLGDDEGWRLEIPGLPELTQVGAFRCHDLTESSCLLPQLGSGPNKKSENNGFYSLADYQEIIIAAQQRHIQIIPSFDMPGHSRAAVKSMAYRYRRLLAEGKVEQAEQYLLSDPDDKSRYESVQFYNDNTLNVCRESTYQFIEKVISEMITMHDVANVPLTTYHIGADETPGAWKDSPICQKFLKDNQLSHEQLGSYFIEKVSQLLAEKNIQAAGWSDGLSHVDPKNMPVNTQANAWTPLFWNGHQVAHKMANQGWEVVVSIPDVTYFDFPYEADPKERGYYWGSRFTNTRQVFEFMPDNLPLHAEIWTDRMNNPMTLDDRPKFDEQDNIVSRPMKVGKKFKGIQAHLWSEMVRSDDIAAYMLFPRLIALAERAWHKPEWEPAYNTEGAFYSKDSEYFTSKHQQLREKDWQTFAAALAIKELPKLSEAGWTYRIPTVGAVVKDNKLLFNTVFPGLSIEYRVADKEWQTLAEGKLSVTLEPSEMESIEVRAFIKGYPRKGRATRVR